MDTILCDLVWLGKKVGDTECQFVMQLFWQLYGFLTTDQFYAYLKRFSFVGCLASSTTDQFCKMYNFSLEHGFLTTS